MTWLYISLTWLAAVFVANEIGLGRMNPWMGMFVFAVLVLGTIRSVRMETRRKNSEAKFSPKEEKRSLRGEAKPSQSLPAF